VPAPDGGGHNPGPKVLVQVYQRTQRGRGENFGKPEAGRGNNFEFYAYKIAGLAPRVRTKYRQTNEY
jgi:hypothetical protein